MRVENRPATQLEIDLTDNILKYYSVGCGSGLGLKNCEKLGMNGWMREDASF
jgi:hypothetical protein